MTLRVRSDRRLIRAEHRSERFVLAELTAPAAPPRQDRDPVNLAFVLDRSGSMNGPKLALARRAVEAAIARLRPADRFSVVVYDDRIDVAVESTSASAEARRLAVERLREVDARGSTDLGGGWLRGSEQVALGLVERGVNRVLLLTDGLANVGITDPAALAHHAGELRARGVTTTTFGVGTDFDEALLQSMADAGGGHFYFIGDAVQIADHISSEVGELLAVTARSVTLEVTAADSIEVGTLSPYPSERRGNRTIVALGDLVSEQDLEVVLRLRFPHGPIGSEAGILAAVSDRDGAFGGEPQTLGWTYADDPANDAQPRDVAVDRAVAGLFAARARQAAVDLNRRGDYGAAAAMLRGVAGRIAGYAGGDAELDATVAILREDEERWSAPAPEMARKVAFAASAYTMRGRSASGQARRPKA